MVYVLWEVRSPGSSCMLTGEIFTDLGGPWRLRGPGPPAAAILCIAAPPISIALPALRTSLDDFRAILRPSCQVRPSAVLTFLYRIWLKSRPRRSNSLSLPDQIHQGNRRLTKWTGNHFFFFFFFTKLRYSIRWSNDTRIRSRTNISSLRSSPRYSDESAALWQNLVQFPSPLARFHRSNSVVRLAIARVNRDRYS